MLRRVLVLGLLLTGAGCKHGGGEVEPAPSPVRVEVNNKHALPMEIYAVGGGINQRLGTVHPGMVAQFVIPQGVVVSGAVVLEARPDSRGPSFRSNELLLAPGSVVDLVIGARLFNSTASIRP